MRTDQQEEPRPIPLGVLRQPIRIRIIEICTEWERVSPSEMVDEQLCDDIESLRHMTPKQKLTNIAYHCRELKKFGFLRVVGEEPKRGSTKHYYSATVEVKFVGDDWSALGQPEREGISQVVWHRFNAQVEGSMRQQTFDARTDRWLAWGPMDLDQRGWDELMKKIDGTFKGVEAIRRQSAARLAASGEEPIRATYGLFGFESPRLPERLTTKAKHQHRSSK